MIYFGLRVITFLYALTDHIRVSAFDIIMGDQCLSGLIITQSCMIRDLNCHYYGDQGVRLLALLLSALGDIKYSKTHT